MRIAHLLWLTPFLSFIAGYVLMSFLYTSQAIIAPSLVGQNINQALITLCKKNLNIRIIGYKDCPELAEGTILSQTPAPGTYIKENQALYLTITQKPPATQIPSLQGKSLEEANQILEKQDLHIQQHALACDYPKGKCCAQSPCAGALVTDNTIMVYASADENKPVIMPLLKGKTVQEVISFLALHDINPTIFHEFPVQPTHQCIHCMVYDQRPAAGSLIYIHGDNTAAIQLQVQ